MGSSTAATNAKFAAAAMSSALPHGIGQTKQADDVHRVRNVPLVPNQKLRRREGAYRTGPATQPFRSFDSAENLRKTDNRITIQVSRASQGIR
jgi:hypothetical protein